MVTRTLLGAQMVCARCGTAFEGRFCPNCGTPAAAPPQVEGTPPNVRCSRCGTLYSGRFCPTCGLPAWSAWIPPMPPRPSVGYGFLNVAWMFSLIAFLVVLAIATAGLFGVLVPISAGVQNIRQGGTAGPGFDSTGAWVFSPWGGPAAGSVNATGGNPGGYGEISLPGPASSTDAIISGYWSQPFNATGSSPYIASVRLDYRVFRVSNILANVTLAVYVDSSSGTPRLGTDVWKVTLAQPTNWTRAQSVYAPTGEVIPAIDVSSAVARPGRYYLKIAAIAWNRAGGPGTDTVLGVDNVGLRWATAAFVQVALYAPIPILLYYTQDPLAFYLWTAGLVAATVACLAVLVLRDHRKLLETIRMRSDRMPMKLRSRSAIVALMQTFLAVMFVNIVVGLVAQPPAPSFVQEIPQWYFLFQLVNAPVYEELLFRAMMIGLPLALGSLYLRAIAVSRGRLPPASTKGRYLLGSLRYLVGGGMSRRTPLSLLLPASLFLIVSSILFGLAHAPGYGDWKVLPTTVGALAMAYLFLRHGLHAAIIFHFALDVFVATAYLVGLSSPLGIAMDLGFFFLIIPGAGFFAYYVLYIARLFQDVLRPSRGAGSPAPTRVAGPAGSPPAPYGWYATPPGSTLPPAGPPPPSVPPAYVPATRPPAYGTSPVEYRCPRCAWVEAAYENGRFRCLRCGYVA